jgi:transcription elongation factor Elf1
MCPKYDYKRCPKCGYERLKKQTALKDCGKGVYYVQCKNCGWEKWSK